MGGFIVSKPKLHEILAVEQDVEKVATNIVDEAKVTFTKKANLFHGQIKTAEMFDADAPTPATEVLKLEETVPSKLRYVGKAVARWLDVVLQKESTNQRAVADLVVDGEVLATAVPATFLLGLENKVKRLRDMYQHIPTLQPGVRWEPAPDQGDDVFSAADEIERFITQKQTKSTVLYEATKEHPAQIDKWTEDVKVGRYLISATSGMITPARKAEILERLDKLGQAAKAARMRANATEVEKASIGQTLVRYVNG
jgi:hypothetical protein